MNKHLLRLLPLLLLLPLLAACRDYESDNPVVPLRLDRCSWTCHVDSVASTDSGDVVYAFDHVLYFRSDSMLLSHTHVAVSMPSRASELHADVDLPGDYTFDGFSHGTIRTRARNPQTDSDTLFTYSFVHDPVLHMMALDDGRLFVRRQ